MNTDKILTTLRSEKINHFYLLATIVLVGLGFLLLKLMIETYVSWVIKHEILWDNSAGFVLGIGFLFTFAIFYGAIIMAREVRE